ncbi:MAG: hydrophobic/amphiphilic exporter-1 (mainly G- bacteria) HAE1 family [Ignavibacteria bacterium]|nr:MAG: hydrophobic/amphiphilic exporter-1 (mainly G- bacteria) HAE1 family [Ignavibacteria bacterium]KAF0156131.1 MAG: hydrophobic/amphiphilic exporter-1 (mainly G- bacteria) HAE1 family [Ignavibacteria bacterium]
MSLSSLSIRRPVLSIVLSLVIVLLGVIGFTFLGVREYPSIDPPIITVGVSYVGANADIIESQITEPLEESINGIAGIRSITSVSRDGRSSITVEFNVDVDLEDAANDVRDRVSRSVANLPPDANPPVVTKTDADANPIMYITLKSETKSLLEVSDIASNLFKERLQTISGVSEVRIFGEKRFAMRLWLDPYKMASLKVSPQEIRSALSSENVELPSGRIEGENIELAIRTKGRMLSVYDFNNLIVREDRGQLIRLSDVGYAELGPENEYSVLKINGVPMISVVLLPQPGSNHIEIADECYRRLEQLKKDIPSDIVTEIRLDGTKYIRNSIEEVEETILIAFVLVIIIIFLFLRDWRTTIIPILAIPISLIGVFFIMYLSNFTINVLTLLGIVLAIGLVVDDAIVVLENIYKKIEDGMEPVEAGMKGSSEIFFAIISTTVSLAVVFLPIIFLQGLTGRLFREFGIVIAGSVLISAFVALTLTPMLSTRIIKRRTQHSRFYQLTEPFFVNLIKSYEALLSSFLKRRWLGFVVMLAAILLIALIMPMLQSELAPIEDRNELRLSTITPEGSTYNFTYNFMERLNTLLEERVPESESIMMGVAMGFGGGGNNSGFIRLSLVEPEDRSRSQQQIYEDLSKQVNKLSDGRTFVVQSQTIGTQRGGGLPVQYVVQAPTIEKLREVIPFFLDEARKNETFAQADVNLKFSKPELVLEIDRSKARELGVAVVDIAQTLQLALSGQRYGFFIMNGKQYQIIGQLTKEYRSKPIDLQTLYVKSRKGELLQLDNFISVKTQSTPPQLYRFNRYVSATFSASLAPGKTIGDGIEAMDAIADKVLDETFSTALTGTSKDFKESSSSLLFTFLLALTFLYLILAAQFESFRDPLIIMFTVPLALAGAFISLFVFDQTMNIFSEIGLVMLIGLVTKNGILIVEFANQKKAQGLSLLDAVREASVLRFRPILMTSLATILGTLPIALALGAGAESRVSMGIAVIGGLTFATVLTLFVIPAVYTYFSEKTKSVSNVD